jgi:hypothetical protein
MGEEKRQNSPFCLKLERQKAWMLRLRLSMTNFFPLYGEALAEK